MISILHSITTFFKMSSCIALQRQVQSPTIPVRQWLSRLPVEWLDTDVCTTDRIERELQNKRCTIFWLNHIGALATMNKACDSQSLKLFFYRPSEDHMPILILYSLSFSFSPIFFHLFTVSLLPVFSPL